jgi:ribonucleoside-diphosphate reductase alpha chain
MSVNLYSFVEHPFTDKAYFNYDKFKDVVYKAQRLMDDIVDLEEEKINKILNKIENDPEPEEIKWVEKQLWVKILRRLKEGRRTGLSSIGLADTFASLQINYGSKESITLAEEIYKQFAISAYKSSIDMARERGAFPIFDIKKEEHNPFLHRIYDNICWDEHYIGEGESIGRRNIALLTVPPSGTISMFGNKNGISSGIEPVYQLYYKRRRKLEKGNPKITFVDQNGDGWEEYTVLHPKFKEWVNHYTELGNASVDWNNIDIEKLTKLSPYYKSTAYEIDPLQRVKLQATIQKYLCHSISSTINLPEGTSEETVSNIYMEAWKQGCKGITVYVNHSREGVLIDADKKESEFKQHDAPKRPKSLPCIVHKTKSKGKEWLVIVGLLNDKPYEVFTIENKYNIQYSEIKGTIIKVKKGQYDLSLENEIYIEDFAKDLPDTENLLTRMISTALRHGSNIQFIVEQLNKSEGDVTSFGKATSRILKLYIEDNKVSNDTCPECGATLIYQNGCKICNQCGYSKCG